MGRHHGNNGIVKIGGTAVGDVVDWDYQEGAAEVDTSGLNDTWDTGGPGSANWSGNITVRFNPDDATQQSLRARAVVNLELFTEGDASGKEYHSGTAFITSVGIGVQRNTVVDKKITFKGDGLVSVATVA